jgi:hypothetical protein
MARRLAVVFGLIAGVAGAAEPSALTGQDLFTGARPFRNGGAPCGACHSPGGPWTALHASLGPELASSVASMDPGSLDGLLEALPFPTMTPIYERRPLTPEERADLAAYLIAAARQGPPREAWRADAAAVAVAALLFAGLALAWRRRKGSTRARLLARVPHASGGSR